MSEVKVNSFGVELPEPSDRMREAVRLYDEGVSAKDAAEQMGVTVGTYGNAKSDGLKRTNRADELQGNGSGGGSAGTRSHAGSAVTTRGPVEMMETEIAAVDARIEKIQARVTEATEHANEDGGVIADREINRLEDVIKAAREALDAFDEETFVTAERARRTEARDRVIDQCAKEVDTLTTRRSEHEAALEAVKVALASVGA